MEIPVSLNFHFIPQLAPYLYTALGLQAPPSQFITAVPFFVTIIARLKRRDKDMPRKIQFYLPKTTKAGMAEARLLCKLEGYWNKKNRPTLIPLTPPQNGYCPRCH